MMLQATVMRFGTCLFNRFGKLFRAVLCSARGSGCRDARSMRIMPLPRTLAREVCCPCAGDRSEAMFPLTPALSPGERGLQIAILGDSNTLRFADRLAGQ